jgi:uncharacterized protein YndB with AHSA1/START domain
MSQWLLSTPQETISQDHRAGGLWRWTMINDEDGTRYPTEFREIVESERLVFTWGGEDNRPAVITLTFDDHDGGTRLTLHLVGPAESITDETGVEKGWSELLDSLETFLARRVTW